ncbi:unnamed protein product [Closterium sp. Naga37s-1]|nr:unnamed protein product [Closterium sp. Naga37s-1]
MTAGLGAGVGAGMGAGMGAGVGAGILAGMGAGMLDVLQLFLIDAAMLSAALFALFHLSLALLFPNMALGIAAGLLTVYSNSVLPAVALQPLTMLLL